MLALCYFDPLHFFLFRALALCVTGIHGSLELLVSPSALSSSDHFHFLFFAQSFNQEEDFFDVLFFSKFILRFLGTNDGSSGTTLGQRSLSPKSFAKHSAESQLWMRVLLAYRPMAHS